MRNPSARTADARAFTLVEILVTTAMFALLAGAALSVFNAGTRAASTTRRCREMLAHGQTALDAMCADIRAAAAHAPGTPPSGDDVQRASGSGDNSGGSGTITRLTSLAAQNEGRDCNTLDLVIARTNPDRKEPDAGGHAAIGYYLNTDLSAGPRGLFRRENRTPGDDFLSGGRAAAIAPGVTQFTLQFYDGVDWVSGWSNDQDFPKAVRISIVVEDEAGLENPLFLTTTVSVMAQ